MAIDLSSQKISVFPFLIIGFVVGGLLAALTHADLHAFPFAFLPHIKDINTSISIRLLLYYWVGFYGLMFLLAYPNKCTTIKLFFTTFLPSLLASLPFYWQSNSVFFPFTLMCFSAYALNAFHIHYHAKQFHFSYETLFHAVWDTFIKLMITLFFVILCWAIIFVSAELFKNIGVTFIREWISKTWFDAFTTAIYVSIGLYITTKINLVVRTMRMVLLYICQYLFVPLAIMSILFIITSIIMLKQHSMVSSNSFLLLFIAFWSVVFFNGVYQDGATPLPYPRYLLWICRIFLCITPVFSVMAMIKIYYGDRHGILLNGLTPDNVTALIYAGLLLIYNLTYAVIAISRKKPLFKSIEKANFILAIILILCALCVTYPIIDNHMFFKQHHNFSDWKIKIQ